jgi:hypothetical protein
VIVADDWTHWLFVGAGVVLIAVVLLIALWLWTHPESRAPAHPDLPQDHAVRVEEPWPFDWMAAVVGTKWTVQPAEQPAELRAAARQVIDTWEQGDLASAVRELDRLSR